MTQAPQVAAPAQDREFKPQSCRLIYAPSIHEIRYDLYEARKTTLRAESRGWISELFSARGGTIGTTARASTKIDPR
jgi:hypothetical protein